MVINTKKMQKQPSFKKIINEFNKLKKIIIDTSSIIYFQRINIWENVSEVVTIFTIPEILKEYGYPLPDINIIESKNIQGDNDRKLIFQASKFKIPLVSEDKKILREMKKRNIPFFNTLMILNFLYFKNKINNREYVFYLEELKNIAFYNEEVWKFGKKVYNKLSQNNR